jgi:hypothetical protein
MDADTLYGPSFCLGNRLSPSATRTAFDDRGVYLRESIPVEAACSRRVSVLAQSRKPSRDKYDACIKVVMKSGNRTAHSMVEVVTTDGNA